jgi:hypothetical protein
MVHVEVSVTSSVHFVVNFEYPSVNVQVVSYKLCKRKVKFLFVIDIY